MKKLACLVGVALLAVGCSVDNPSDSKMAVAEAPSDAPISTPDVENAPVEERRSELTLSGGMDRTFEAGMAVTLTVEEFGQWYLAFGLYDEEAGRTVSLRLMLPVGESPVGREVALEPLFPDTSGFMMLEDSAVTNTVDGTATVVEAQSSGVRVVFDARISEADAAPVDIHGVLKGDLDIACIIRAEGNSPDDQPGTAGTFDSSLQAPFCQEALSSLGWE